MPASAVLQLSADSVRPVPAEGITCLEGLCWATQSGDPADYILRPGVSWRPAPGRRALVWALTDAALLPAVGRSAPRRWGAVGFLLRALCPVRTRGEASSRARGEPLEHLPQGADSLGLR